MGRARTLSSVRHLDAGEWIEDPSLESDARAWLQCFLRDGATTYIENVETDFRLLDTGHEVLPTTINTTQYHSSYICSPYNAFIDYAGEECEKLDNPGLKVGVRLLLRGLSSVLRWGRINCNVHVNNWLLSTNLYPAIAGNPFPDITEALQRKWPSHAIVFRSLNRVHNREIIEKLVAVGYQLLPSRQVYLFDPSRPEYLRKIACRRDQKLLAQTDYILVGHDEIRPSDYARMAKLYSLLYLEKYSQHNPRFSEKFMAACHRHRLLHLTGLRDRQGTLQGIVGTFTRDNVTSAPLVGYNTARPQKEGLYRLLMALVMREAAQRKLQLNLSAGASSFKILRGGHGEIEYTAIYTRHLPWYRRAVLSTLRLLLHCLAVPILKRYRL
jgi:hypothetical protein